MSSCLDNLFRNSPSVLNFYTIRRNISTVVPGFRVLGFRALPGFRAPKAVVDGPSALNLGTEVLFEVKFQVTNYLELRGCSNNTWQG